MADEQVENVTAEVETPTPEPTVHPLEPGGERFNQVYRDLKDREREAQRLREENAELRGRVSAVTVAPPPQPTQPQRFTPQQLQEMVDRGRISPAEMADQLNRQYAVDVETRIEQKAVQREKLKGAADEVGQYMKKLPALTDTTSDTFRKVSATAYEISEDMGLPVTDARVQRRALREAFGPVDSVKDAAREREYERRAADAHTEVGRGGPPGGGKADPLKNVPKMYMDWWKQKGYTHEQMVEEAKYVRPLRRPRG